MTTKINTNGQVRKSLAEQIDRLDGMLDGLSDGLNEAVAEAVKNAVGAAVQQAVQTVLREVLSSPEMMARLHAASPAAPGAPAASAVPAVTTPQSSPSVPKGRWKQRWAMVRLVLAACLSMARTECARRLVQARRCAACVWDRVIGLGRIMKPMLTAVGVGATMGVVACWARPWLTMAANGAAEFGAKASAQVRTMWQMLTAPALAWIQ